MAGLSDPFTTYQIARDLPLGLNRVAGDIHPCIVRAILRDASTLRCIGSFPSPQLVIGHQVV